MVAEQKPATQEVDLGASMNLADDAIRRAQEIVLPNMSIHHFKLVGLRAVRTGKPNERDRVVRTKLGKLKCGNLLLDFSAEVKLEYRGGLWRPTHAKVGLAESAIRRFGFNQPDPIVHRFIPREIKASEEKQQALLDVSDGSGHYCG